MGCLTCNVGGPLGVEAPSILRGTADRETPDIALRAFDGRPPPHSDGAIRAGGPGAGGNTETGTARSRLTNKSPPDANNCGSPRPIKRERSRRLLSDNLWNNSGRHHYLGMVSSREHERQLDLLHAAAIDMRHLISRSVTVLEDSERLLVQADRMDKALIDRQITFDSD